MYVLPCIKDLDSATLLFLLTLDKPPVNTKYDKQIIIIQSILQNYQLIINNQ